MSDSFHTHKIHIGSIICIFCSLLTNCVTQTQNAKFVLLDELDISKITQGTDRPRSTGDMANLVIKGVRYRKGIHTRTESRLYVRLDGKAEEFTGIVGIDDRNDQYRKQQVDKQTSFAEFILEGDGKILWRSGEMKFGDDPKPVKVKLEGIKELLLKVTGGPGHTHADWADAGFTYSGESPVTAWSPEELAVDRENIHPLQPGINGAMVAGIRPGTPFYYPIAATGARPMTFSAEGLPEGLILNGSTGIIGGTPLKEGEYTVRLTASNNHGSSSRNLLIVVGDKLALTPPMGFLSWNVIEGSISATVMREIADAFVDYGLRDVGYQYIIMDDCWEGGRDEFGNIYPDTLRFPDGMKDVGDYLHEKGLKLGIYSSPGARTCAGYSGTLGYEENDVIAWTSWGVDYLKYDYCSAPRDRARELYILMGSLLEKSDRSVLYSLGAGDHGPEWGKDSKGHLWRTAGDIRDQWFLGNENGIIECFDGQAKFTNYQHPGAWNDPDMLLAGIYGKGGSANDLNAKGCTDTEYRSQMSLWAMLSAPLMISADVRNISRSALEILTNPEVIDVDQNPLGNLPIRIGPSSELEVWVKDMSDGSKVVALLNRSESGKTISVKWSELGLDNEQFVRDLWLRKDLGKIVDSYSANVPSHGVDMIRVYFRK